ncbi:ABC transporter ATP-binding protein [Oceanobacillus sp. CFH 90083]|uniref:ABC transporter ATP-binding protein n=1 Tax=Oceanobacillus sp. CFH 90083 TaxID=2592336 RepID=UPI00128B1DC0|nr:ABC transporter ATP-binding protein [Oceanobacillus sp. CFH 90083]
MSYIELKDITKSYHAGNNILEEIDLTIEKGEFFVLVGPSGSGKSTLLRMIAGLEEVTGGILKMDEKIVNHLQPKDRNLSMVFQNYALYPHLSVEQNILFGLKAKKISKTEQQKRLKETAEMMGLSDLLGRKPRQLSGGQRQRVALARSVVSEAPLCLMDEPLSNLDAKLRAQMRVEIRRLQKQLGLTLIYVTHDQVEAMTMGDRIMVLNDGKIQQVGKPITLYNEPANLFVASFIGSPKMNIGRAEIKEAPGLLVNNTLAFSADARLQEALEVHKDIVVGIRPEHIQPATHYEATHSLEVVNVEQLGNETSLALDVGGELWTAKWPGQWEIETGHLLEVYISQEHLSFFDAQTEKLIRPASFSGHGEVQAI